MAFDRSSIRSQPADLGVKKVMEAALDLLDSFTLTTTTTPATGTCAVQFVFRDCNGKALTKPITGTASFTNSTGLAFANATSCAVLTNGAWRDVSAGYVGQYITTAAGLLGVTVTAGTGSYYMTFEMPNGQLLTSPALVSN